MLCLLFTIQDIWIKFSINWCERFNVILKIKNSNFVLLISNICWRVNRLLFCDTLCHFVRISRDSSGRFFKGVVLLWLISEASVHHANCTLLLAMLHTKAACIAKALCDRYMLFYCSRTSELCQSIRFVCMTCFMKDIAMD